MQFGNSNLGTALVHMYELRVPQNPRSTVRSLLVHKIEGTSVRVPVDYYSTYEYVLIFVNPFFSEQLRAYKIRDGVAVETN